MAVKKHSSLDLLRMKPTIEFRTFNRQSTEVVEREQVTYSSLSAMHTALSEIEQTSTFIYRGLPIPHADPTPNPWAARAEYDRQAAERQAKLDALEIPDGYVPAGFILDHKRREVAQFVKSAPKGKTFKTATFHNAVIK